LGFIFCLNQAKGRIFNNVIKTWSSDTGCHGCLCKTGFKAQLDQLTEKEDQ